MSQVLLKTLGKQAMRKLTGNVDKGMMRIRAI